MTTMRTQMILGRALKRRDFMGFFLQFLTEPKVGYGNWGLNPIRKNPIKFYLMI